MRSRQWQTPSRWGSQMADQGRYGGIDEPYDMGVPFSPGHPDDPGIKFAEEADLTVYWPFVRPCWEDR